MLEYILTTFEVFNGWLATQLVTHSSVSIFFAAFLMYIFLLIVWSQMRNHEFDIMDIAYSYDHVTKTKSLNTAKVLLVGTFITSTYYVIQNPSDNSLNAYLLAWVANGGIYAFNKPKTVIHKKDEPEEKLLS